MPPKAFFDPHLRRKEVVSNEDGLSFPRALVVAIAFAVMQFAVDHKENEKRIRNLKNKYGHIRTRTKHQLLEARSLMRRAGLGDGPYTERHLNDVAAAYPSYRFEWFEKAPSGRGYDLVHVANPKEKLIAKIAYCGGRFDFWKDVRSTCGKSRCKACHKLCARTNNHVCPEKCSGCHRTFAECPAGIVLNGIRCVTCNRFFKSQACFDAHKISTANAHSVCQKMYHCLGCEKLVIRNREPNHQCGRVRICTKCKERVPANHSTCFWNPPTAQEKQRKLEKQKHFKIIAYDLETVQYAEDEEGNLSFLPRHLVNLCAWSRLCDQCYLEPIDTPCANCGPKRGELIYKFGEKAEQASKRIIKEFLEWLLYDPHNNSVILLAHNGSRFDTLLLFPGLIDLHIYPLLISKGTKVFSLVVEPPKYQRSRFHNSFTFKDSYLFFSSPLSKLPETFGFSEDGFRKGDFPHALNTEKNFERTFLGAPDIRYFNLEHASEAKKKDIEEYLESIKNKTYFFKQELLAYCKNDVEILHKAIVAFLKVCMESSGINPYVHCCTIASYAHFILRHNYLEPYTLCVLPELGFQANDRVSVLSLNYIQFIEKRDNVQLQYKLRGGEKVIHDPLLNRKYKLDAYNPATNEAIEIHGCMYHGCERCFHPHAEHPLRKPMLNSEVRQETEQRVRRLRELGINVTEIFEHEIKTQLSEDKEMRDYFKANKRHCRLVARNGFLEATATRKIYYLDFNSLYPYVCATGLLPVGAPQVITSDFESFDTHCPYNGMIFCSVLPNPSLRYPIIGAKINGKLIFTLCRTCAAEQNKDACTHRLASERYLPSIVVTSVELDLAIKRGYKVVEVFEVWHYQDMQPGAYFRNFILKHIAMKQENSGWPSGVESDEQKRAYCEMIRREEGYVIDPAKVQKNPSMRTLAKLICNTTYGKMGESNDKEEKGFFHVDSQAFLNFLDDQNYELTDLDFTDDKTHAYASRKPLIEKVESKPYTNVVVAAFITALGRTRLYSCQERLGERLCYVDTDSVIFTADDTLGEDRLEDMCASFLGKLENEIEDGYEISHFVSTAPKAYVLRIVSKTDPSDYKIMIKQKGINLTTSAKEKVTFESLKWLVDTYVEGEENEIVADQFLMQKSLFDGIKSLVQQKKIRVVMNKLRVLEDSYCTLPFGYRDTDDIVIDI